VFLAGEIEETSKEVVLARLEQLENWNNISTVLYSFFISGSPIVLCVALGQGHMSACNGA
jgi:hypothetical protein